MNFSMTNGSFAHADTRAPSPYDAAKCENVNAGRRANRCQLLKIFSEKLGLMVIASTLALFGPVAALSAAPFVTPRYGMTCDTGTKGGFGSYVGYARCKASVQKSKWKVRVSCSWGLNPETIWVITDPSDGWYTLESSPTCWWGINWVQVIEGR